MPPILRSRQAKQRESVGRANYESSGEASENTDSQYVPQVPREHSTSTTDSDPDSSGCSVPAGVNDADVLLGRGKGAYEHKGNRICTKIVASRIPKYAAASKNKDKILITSEIVNIIKSNGGRFLRIGSSTGALYEVTDNEARLKVAQALRHRRSLIKDTNQTRATSRRPAPPRVARRSKRKAPTRTRRPNVKVTKAARAQTQTYTKSASKPVAPSMVEEDPLLLLPPTHPLPTFEHALDLEWLDEMSVSLVSEHEVESEAQREIDELGEDSLEGALEYDESSMRGLNLDNFEWLENESEPSLHFPG